MILLHSSRTVSYTHLDVYKRQSENRFARADLEHILLCVDDDMRMEALRQTNYVKSIVTAQGKMDLERKDKTVAPAGGEAFEARFIEAMNDDFNTPEAYSVLFDMAREEMCIRDSSLPLR